MQPRIVAPGLLVLLSATSASGQSVTPYGAGTAGQGGFVPRAWIQGGPYVGNSQLQVTVDRGTVGVAAVLVLAGGAASYPGPGFTLLVDPLVPPFFLAGVSVLTGGAGGTPGIGGGALTVPLPADPSLRGASLFGQWVLLDTAAPTGVAASDGLRITVTQGPLAIAAGLQSVDTFVPPAGPGTTQSAGTDPAAAAFNRDGSLALLAYRQLGPPATGLEIYDASTQPMTLLTVAPMAAGPLALAVHPDDQRVYVPYRLNNSSGAIGYHDIRPGSPTFGTRLGHVNGITNPGLLSQVAYASISQNGRVLVVAVSGLFAGIHDLLVIDVDPASATRDQLRRQITISTQVMIALSGVAVTPEGRYAYVAGLYSNLGRLAQVDLNNGAIVRQVTLPGSTDGLAYDPRGRFLVGSTIVASDAVLVVSLEPGPGFFTSRTFTTNGLYLGPVALTPDGQTVLGPALTNGAIAAFDVTTGAPVWSSSTLSVNYFVAAR
jgi:hypothetical protein